jgi:hypothetical protein
MSETANASVNEDWVPPSSIRWPEGDRGVRMMVRYGISQVRAGRADGLQLNVFNKAEANICRAMMEAEAPDIPYRITRCV